MTIFTQHKFIPYPDGSNKANTDSCVKCGRPEDNPLHFQSKPQDKESQDGTN